MKTETTPKVYQPIKPSSPHYVVTAHRTLLLRRIRYARRTVLQWETTAPAMADRYNAQAKAMDVLLYCLDRSLQRSSPRVFARIVAQSNADYVAECRRPAKAPTPAPFTAPPAILHAAA